MQYLNARLFIKASRTKVVKVKFNYGIAALGGVDANSHIGPGMIGTPLPVLVRHLAVVYFDYVTRRYGLLQFTVRFQHMLIYCILGSN